MFSKFRHSKMEEFQLPEMLRTPLEELVLQIKILGLGRVIPFLQKALEPPKEKSVQNALQCLQELVSGLFVYLFVAVYTPRIGQLVPCLFVYLFMIPCSLFLLVF